MPAGPDEIFNEVYGIITDVESQFQGRSYQSPYTAFVDYATWRALQQHVESNRIGSVGNCGCIQYQNWKIIGLPDLNNEIRMFPCEVVCKKLNRR
jgi:hypothetical protein